MLVALVTDHCCTLIVICKEEALRQKFGGSPRDNGDGAGNESLLHGGQQPDLERCSQQFQYGDIGAVACGRWGQRIVDTALVFTQYGFCIAYLIFLGTTINALAPSVDIVVGGIWLMMLRIYFLA